MSEVRVLRVLKDDSFGRVELLERGAERRIRRVACGGSIPGSRLVAHILLGRERRALLALEGVAGVPRLADETEFTRAASLDGAIPRSSDVGLRDFVAGAPLHRAERLPADFFERLEELVRELHARGVCHNDLHKEQNVIVGDDGWPWLIDFQLASCHSSRSRKFASRARDDLRHVAKHRRRYLRYMPAETPREIEKLPPRSLIAAIWRRTAKPLYNFVTRSLLRTRDGEERRETLGIWPHWTAPVGPRSTVPASDQQLFAKRAGNA
jgi:predicted Ser/Thr protein kinase